MGNAFSEPPQQKIIVFIEGNISAGKSTLISNLKQAGYPVWEEAVTQLTQHYVDEHGHNILDLYYKDMKANAFRLQMASLNTRWTIIKEALQYLEDHPSDRNVVFIERSLETDVNTFALNLREQGKLDNIDWRIYLDSLDNKLNDIEPLFEGIKIVYFYLRVDPTVCDDRRINRSRAEESSIPITYMNDLHSKLEKWLVGNDKMDNPVHVIDANKSADEVAHAIIQEVRTLFQ